MASKLPIEGLSESDFLRFKEKYLDDDILSPEAIREIVKFFGVGLSSTGRVSCDEMHAHKYKCVHFYNAKTGIVSRLIDEISMYRAHVKNIRRVVERTPE